MTRATAHVEVVLPSTNRQFIPAYLRIRVEDTSEMDVRARTLSALTVEILNGLDLEQEQTFTFDIPYVGNFADLNVSAILSTRLDGAPRSGDLITVALARISENGLCRLRLKLIE